jgi:DNA-binding transcriptional MerR regulator
MRETKYQLIVLQPRRDQLRLEEVASRANVHPQIVRRLVDLGLIEPADTPSTGILFDPEVVHRIRVIQRLRRDLGINLQGIGVILELLDRLKRYE